MPALDELYSTREKTKRSAVGIGVENMDRRSVSKKPVENSEFLRRVQKKIENFSEKAAAPQITRCARRKAARQEAFPTDLVAFPLGLP